MNNLKSSFILKLLSVILISVLGVVFIFSCCGLVIGFSEELFDSPAKTKMQIENMLESNLVNLSYKFWNNPLKNQVYLFEKGVGDVGFPEISGNVMYELKDASGNVIYSDLDKSEITASFENDYQIDYNENGFIDEYESETSIYGDEVTKPAESANLNTESKNFTLMLYLKKDLKEKDGFYYIVRLMNYISESEGRFFSLSVISLVVSILLFIYLMCSAGHKRDEEKIHLSRFDKFPVDLLTVILGSSILGLAYTVICAAQEAGEMVFRTLYYNNAALPLIFSYCVLSVMLGITLFLVLCITISVRLKTETLIKSSAAYKCVHGIWKIVRGTAKRIPYIVKSVLIILGIMFLSFIILFFSFYDGTPLYIVGFIMSLSALAIYIAVMFGDVKKGTEKIVRGNTTEKINSKYMFGNLKEHAENVNSINDGISRAVEQKMKSERFKTELITNVSHDIKTPLTSIINYVDLLSKENIESETANEYIGILNRQSARLKKLIDDLMEASKASTGNLTVNYSKFEIGIILSQALGEYEERFLNNNLEVVLNKPTDTLFIMADSRHMWRIFDNIFNNIVKYAQPCTRVYIDVQRKGGIVEILCKNISKQQLNISGDELMERFVRGDSSRNTEGSGLGLSIARSLAELQKGGFSVHIDGDLFKVRLAFPLTNEN